MVVVLSLSLLSGNRRAGPLIAFLLSVVRVGFLVETLSTITREQSPCRATAELTSTGFVELKPSSSP